jgi:hypothetical protein
MLETEQTAGFLAERITKRELRSYGVRAMILDEVTKRTLANMETALERACDRLPSNLGNHEVRKSIALKILERAKSGEAGLEALTDAALTASATFSGALPCGIDVTGAAHDAKPLESK